VHLSEAEFLSAPALSLRGQKRHDPISPRIHSRIDKPRPSPDHWIVRRGGTAIFRNSRVALALALPLALCACFKSDFALITIFDSVTPIAEGRYTYVDTDKAAKSVIITHDGTVTKMTKVKDDGSAQIQNLLIHYLGEDFFVVMDAENDYALVQVHDRTVLEFDESSYCDDLLNLARSNRKNISEYGVVQVIGENSHTCKFDSFNGVARAMAALASDQKIVAIRIYQRQ
jgi:hypothetical protein